MTNILKAIKHYAENQITQVTKKYSSTVSVNKVGDSLEFFVKDMFSLSLNEKDKKVKEENYRKELSWLGHATTPPDFIIKNGDAVEVKKIEGLKSTIALNSSFPKDKLYSDDSRITQGCKDCEVWSEKDMIYAIGTVNENILKSLWFVYGDCYCATKNTYLRVADAISDGIRNVEDIELVETTNELGGVRRVDPLGITYLRVRGMWNIEHPSKVFDYIDNLDRSLINVIMSESKYNSFPDIDKANLSKIGNVKIDKIAIKNPNNPAKLLPAVHICIN